MDWNSPMLTVLLVGFVAGVVTVISPCVLPVVFAGGTTGGRRRAVAIVAGLTITFAADAPRRRRAVRHSACPKTS